MKKQSVSLLAIILSASGFLFSCGDKMNKNIGSLTFDSIQVNVTAHLFGDTAKPACNLVVDFTYPVESSDEILKDTLNKYFITACFGKSYKNEKPEVAVQQFKDTYVTEYRNDLEPNYLEDEKGKNNQTSIGAWYSYYKSVKSQIQFYEKNLLIYSINYNEYTGGAHGMYTMTYLNFDLKLMRPLQLNDLFAGKYKEVLTDLIWNQLMAQNKVKTHQELENIGYGSTGEIAPIENFYLSKDGITFYYNVYDIAPYTMGPTEVTIPFQMLEPILSINPVIDELKKQ